MPANTSNFPESLSEPPAPPSGGSWARHRPPPPLDDRHGRGAAAAALHATCVAGRGRSLDLDAEPQQRQPQRRASAAFRRAFRVQREECDSVPQQQLAWSVGNAPLVYIVPGVSYRVFTGDRIPPSYVNFCDLNKLRTLVRADSSVHGRAMKLRLRSSVKMAEQPKLFDALLASSDTNPIRICRF